MSPIPHNPECPVYRNARALIGVDRRGMCTCGAERLNSHPRPGEASDEEIAATILKLLPSIREEFRFKGRHGKLRLTVVVEFVPDPLAPFEQRGIVLCEEQL
jgi:hypothetical protein